MAPSLCTKCQKNVTAASKAFQCYWCDRWTHIRCCEVNEDLYRQMMNYHRLNMNFCCDDCLPRMERARNADPTPPLGSADASSDDDSPQDSPNATCIPVQPTTSDNDAAIPPLTTSTPKKRRTRKRKITTVKPVDERPDLDAPQHHGRRAKPRKRLLKEIRADEHGQPDAILVDEDAQDDGQQHHESGAGQDGAFQ